MPLPDIQLYDIIPNGNGKLYVGKERSASYDWWPGRTRVSLTAATGEQRIGYACDIDEAETICITWMSSGRILDSFERATL